VLSLNNSRRTEYNYPLHNWVRGDRTGSLEAKGCLHMAADLVTEAGRPPVAQSPTLLADLP
jgi:hypothetical protein